MLDQVGDIHSYNLDTKQREIFLHGHHGHFEEDPGVEYRMATTFIKNLRFLDSVSNLPILVHMHSIGGEWGDGMAIYDAIQLCKSDVTILTYGQAESMSSVVLQAADVRIMMPHTYLMLHYGSIDCGGDYVNAQKLATFEKSRADTMLDIYAERCVEGKFFNERYKALTYDKAKAFLRRKLQRGDWYLSSHEAVYHGFADGVITSKKYGSIDRLK